MAAAASEPAADQPLVVFGSVQVPKLCLFHRATGRCCPGCGMSRAFVLLWRGRVREAVKSNPTFPLMFAALVWLALRPMVHIGRRAVEYDRPTPDVASPIKSSVTTEPRS